jgi:hypothetical protein
VTGESDIQDEIYNKQRISILQRITGDGINEYENQDGSIRVNREFDSNETDESD